MEPLTSKGMGRSGVLDESLSLVGAALRHPAAWLFAALYVTGALVYALVGGPSALIKPLAFLAGYALILLVTLAVTTRAPAPAWTEAAAYSRRRLWWQLGALLIFWLLGIGYTFLLFGPVQALVPRYLALVVLGNVALLLLLYVVLPLLTMRWFGVPWRELGFGRGYRVWMVMGMCCLLPVAVLVIQALSGRAVTAIGNQIVSTLLQAAFVEEVFYRGMVLTRLIRLVGTGWGVVLAALLFGAAHAATNLSQDGGILVALAQSIVAQGTFGVVLAALFIRTRNIWAGVVFHALVDGTGL